MSDDQISAILSKLDSIQSTVTELRVNQQYIQRDVSDQKTATMQLAREGCEIGRKHERDIEEIKKCADGAKAGNLAHAIGWPTVAALIIYLIAKAHGIELPGLP